ncbi:Lrp/AsnC family transcriptional regulator [Leekyejoonella antrihumi]|uniref:Lrp/AsnC family transcriptional regulator n=1 Tax=Leekyejoonella antrihumi TaxID=1660198 RepID=A0A563E6M2_9MICO|nr:Lrp/AsnC family transcriptional regulator [Leekyejoonella antrihumi]TWP37949.1 Lrp/AsnC family transcriptional regulator [Leekyejoonella antrihumi]
MENSELIREYQHRSNQIQLDEADLTILRELAADGRIPNNVLAQRAGLAPSTCLNRVRLLRRSGVIRGYHADLDLRALGLDVFALISINVHAQARDRMMDLANELRALPQVLDVYVLGGDRDLMIHVACPTTDALREFVAAHLGSNQAFVNTQTTLVFDHLQPGDAPAPRQ